VAQNRPLRPAAARIFLPLSGPLSRPAAFFSSPFHFFSSARPPSRNTRARARPRAHARARARAAFRPPRTASIFLFERLRGHAPAPQWPRARKFVAGAAPFPAAPASFSPVPPASRRPLTRAPSRPPRPSSLLQLFSTPPPFFSSHPRLPPAADVDVDVDPAIPPSPSLARSPFSPGFAPGVYFKRSLDQAPRRYRARYERAWRCVLDT